MPRKDKTRFRQFTRAISMSALRASQWVLCHLPPWTITTALYLVFPLVWPFLGRLRKIMGINFRTVYGSGKNDKTYQKLIRTCLWQSGRIMIDLLYFVERPQRFADQLSVHGEEHLIKAIKQNKGVVAYTAHLGNFALMFVALIRKGYAVNVLIRPMRDPDFSQFMFDLCAKWHINMITTKPPREFLRRSYRALKKKEILFILLDEIPPDGAGLPVNFLGQTVKRAPGPLLFQRKFNSPIVPMFVTQDEQRRFHIHIEPETKLVTDPDQEIADQRNMNQMTAVIERYVREYPLQWGGWFNKRWSATPS